MTQTKEMNPKQTVKLQPLGDRILARRLEAQETLKGGILLPDSAKKKQEQAEIIAVGTGKKDKKGNPIPLPVKVGDIVLMEKYSGQEVTLDDQEYVILKTDDLIAVIEE
ncbi:MAG: co-chaperone GroES [Waddliaceae bacterium]